MQPPGLEVGHAERHHLLPPEYLRKKLVFRIRLRGCPFGLGLSPAAAIRLLFGFLLGFQSLARHLCSKIS